MCWGKCFIHLVTLPAHRLTSHLPPGVLQGVLGTLIPNSMGSCHGQILIETATHSLGDWLSFWWFLLWEKWTKLGLNKSTYWKTFIKHRIFSGNLALAYLTYLQWPLKVNFFVVWFMTTNDCYVMFDHFFLIALWCREHGEQEPFAKIIQVVPVFSVPCIATQREKLNKGPWWWWITKRKFTFNLQLWLSKQPMPRFLNFFYSQVSSTRESPGVDNPR